jgi:hypothetical protein
MALRKLPLRSDIPKYEFRIDLDLTTYTLAFRFNRRQGRWIMDVKTETDTPLVMGIPVLIGVDLLARFVIDGLPEGNLFAANIENDFVDAGRDDLGNNVVIFYNEASA